MKQSRDEQPTRALLYVRAQHDTAKEHLVQQEQILRDYASQRGYEVAEVFPDEGSARERRRPGFNSLCVAAREMRSRGQNVIVLTVGMDRLIRSTKDFQHFEDIPVEIAGAGNSAASRFIFQMHLAMARAYSRVASEAQTRSRRSG